MATSNHMTEAENAAHPAGVPVDPFAVDFFGGTAPVSEEHELFTEKETGPRKPIKTRKRSDWYKNLPRITNAEAEFSNLLSGLPENLTENAAKLIAETLARYTFRPAENGDCSVISVREVNLNEALRKLNETSKVFLTIGGQPENSVAAAVLNFDFAAALIDSILDGQSAPTGNRRDLSPIEATIIEFLAAGVLGEINDFLGEPLLFLQNIKQTADSFDPGERGAEFVINLKTGDLSGVITVFASQKILKLLDRSRKSFFVKKTDRKKLVDFEKLAREFDLRLQVGRTYLDAGTLSYLEPEDIVLIEQPLINPINQNFSGNSQVLIGKGKNFRLRGAADGAEFDDGLNFRIEEILSEETRRKFTPAIFKMNEKENDLAVADNFENDSPVDETPDDEMPDEQISPSLENVQVALRVELAGSKISLRELQNLRAGQIIALGCGPTDPVRLVTDNNDEPVATGELVEIEGQLGVRLTKVFI